MGSIFRAVAAVTGVLFGIYVLFAILYGGVAVGSVVTGVVLVIYMPYIIIVSLIEKKDALEKRIEELEELQIRIEDREVEIRNEVYKYDC